MANMNFTYYFYGLHLKAIYVGVDSLSGVDGSLAGSLRKWIKSTAGLWLCGWISFPILYAMNCDQVSHHVNTNHVRYLHKIFDFITSGSLYSYRDAWRVHDCKCGYIRVKGKHSVCAVVHRFWEHWWSCAGHTDIEVQKRQWGEGG